MVYLTSCTSVSITDRKQLIILGDDVIYPEAFKAYKDFKNKAKLIESGKEIDEINKVTNNLKTAIKNFYKSEGRKDPTSNFAWEVVLVDNKDVKNAWCMPGGKIAVYTGMLEITKNKLKIRKQNGSKHKSNMKTGSCRKLTKYRTENNDMATTEASSKGHRTGGPHPAEPIRF